MNYLLKSRSKLLFISGLWTMLYSLMLRPIMKLENKVTLKEVDLSEMARQKIVEQFATGWFLMGSVVLLFSLYFQLGEGNYTVIIYQALFYLFFVLRKHEPKVKYISIQLVGLLIVYFLTTLNGPELLKGILLITVLTIIYRQTKLIYNQQKSLTTLNHKKVAFSSNEET